MNGERSANFPGKWRLALAWWLVQAVVIYMGLAVVAWQAGAGKGDLFGFEDVSRLWHAFEEPEFWTYGALFSAGISVLQAILILPVRKPRPMTSRGLPVLTSLATAGVLIAVLLATFFVLAATYVNEVTDSLKILVQDDHVFWFWAIAALCLWGPATILITRWSARRIHEDALRRVAHRLLQGTVIDAVASIPLDIMIRRRESCYCAAPTFFSFILCGVIGTIAMGPAIWLPILVKRRRAWYGGHCAVCGYDMGTIPHADRCPECGTGWKDSKSVGLASEIDGSN